MKIAEFNAELVSALREFVSVHPWEGHRLPGDIFADFLDWCRRAPDGSSPRLWLAHNRLTKNRISKLLVSELGATWYKGPGGRLYRLPEEYQPAGTARGGDTAGGLTAEVPGADGALPVGGGLVPAGRVDLAGEGGLVLEGVASLPLAEHVAAVKAQAAAEDSVSLYEQERRLRPNTAPSRPAPADDDLAAASARLAAGLGAVHVDTVDYAFVVKDGVRYKVPKAPKPEVVTVTGEPNYELPEGTVLDGPTVLPVEAGAAPALPDGLWKVYLSDDEAALPYVEQETLAAVRLPERLVLAGPVDLGYDDAGAPFLACPVHSVDGVPAGAGVVRVPLPWAPDEAPPGELWVDPADVGVTWPPDTAGDEIERAAAAPLPSPEALAAAAGHDALERARARAAAPAAAVFLAADDYQGADPGDWG